MRPVKGKGISESFKKIMMKIAKQSTDFLKKLTTAGPNKVDLFCPAFILSFVTL